MALARSISSWTDSGTTGPVTDYDGSTIQVPVMNPVYAGDWCYTNAAGSTSVCCEASAPQVTAEATRDVWLAAGGIV